MAFSSPGSNLQQIQNLMPGLRLALNQPGQRRDFGAQGGGLAFGGRARGPCIGLAALGLGAGGFGGTQRVFGAFGKGCGGLLRFGCRVIGLGCRHQCGFCAGCGLNRPRRLGLGAGQAGAGLGQEALHRLVAGRQPGGIFGGVGKPGFAGGQAGRSGARGFGGVGKAVVVAVLATQKLADLPFPAGRSPRRRRG